MSFYPDVRRAPKGYQGYTPGPDSGGGSEYDTIYFGYRYRLIFEVVGPKSICMVVTKFEQRWYFEFYFQFEHVTLEVSERVLSLN